MKGTYPMMAGAPATPTHLAPHETLELHELIAYKNVGLFKLKLMCGMVCDPALKQLYMKAIHATECDIRELMHALQCHTMGYREESK